MHYCAFIILAFIVVFAACERPPVTKETAIDHNTVEHSKMGHANINHSTMESSPGAAEQSYDVQFIDTMTAHHQGAIDMAMLADTRAQRAEMKTLARNIISDQQKEVAQMKKWREEWFPGKPLAVNMDLAGMRDGMTGMNMMKLDLLKENAFDIEFISQMIPHHEGAVVMAKQALKKSEKAEIKALAETIIESQEAEIKQMRDWQIAWSR